MKKITPFVLIALFTSPAWLRGSQITVGSSPSIISCVGYLPYPCAPNDLAVHQESAPQTWNWNPSYNTIQIDPEFGERVVRVTDNNTIPTCFGSSTSNQSFSTPASGDVNAWSSDSSYFELPDNAGFDFLFSWNAATMQVTCDPVASEPQKWLPITGGVFGRAAADNHLLFGMNTATGTGCSLAFGCIQKFDVSQYANPSAVPVAVKDLSACAGTMPATLSALGKNWFTWTQALYISADDSRISWASGPVQNEGWFDLIYDQTANKCAWIDTRTGVYGGDLISGGTTSGGFPLTWSSPGAPTPPTITGTTSGSLTPGDTIKACLTLVGESNQGGGNNGTAANGSGVGETSCSAIQSIALGANTALSIPAPTLNAGGTFTSPFNPVPNGTPFNYYNVYACDNTAVPGCTPTLQTSPNLGCSMSAPSPSVTRTGSGTTTYTYTVEAVGANCNTWATATTTNAATLNGSNYNSITAAAVTGATRYRIIAGSFTYGTSTPPLESGTSPVTIYDSAAPPNAVQDNGSETRYFAAVGSVAGNLASTLTALTTTGPTAPPASTLGSLEHSSWMSLDGGTLSLSNETVATSLYWTLGSPTSTQCAITASYEQPPNSYTTCVGHWVLGYGGPIYDGGNPGQLDNNYDANYRPYGAIQSTATRWLTKFPPLDPNGTDSIDLHQSWNNNHGQGDASTPFLLSTESGAGNTSYDSPLYIGRGWAEEVLIVNPMTGVVSRLAHHRASGTAQYESNCSSGCENYFSHDPIAIISGDGKWAMFTSDFAWELGCDPTLSFPITAVSVGNPTTITISVPSGYTAPLANQVGTVLGTSGVAGLNGQWTITGTSPNFTLSGSNLSGTIGSLTNAQFQECTYNASGQVNGPAAASTCGSGSQACKSGASRGDVFVVEVR
ncbi:MAG TPA: hypothetical protein VMT20_10565 [Terriglobia bacterium]|nr:hypothetical protein [Terriglobia bacterium]